MERGRRKLGHAPLAVPQLPAFRATPLREDLVKAELRRFVLSPSGAAYPRPHLKTTRRTKDCSMTKLSQRG